MQVSCYYLSACLVSAIKNRTFVTFKGFVVILLYVIVWVVTGKQKTREYSRIPVTGTVEGNEKQFVLVGNLSYQGKINFHEMLIKGKEIYFELSTEVPLCQISGSESGCGHLQILLVVSYERAFEKVFY